MYPQLYSDIKAEVLAAEWVDKGVYPIDQVVISPAGAAQRPVRRDVLFISDGKNRLADVGKQKEIIDHVFIDVSRSGLYDLLPQRFFHEPIPDREKEGLDDTLEEMRQNKVREKAARLFFLTLEKEIYRSRIELELDERKSLLGFGEFYRSDLFLRIWPELEGIDVVTQKLLFQILPLSHFICGDVLKIETALSIIFDLPVQLAITQAAGEVVVEGHFDKLGKVLLGIDAILGGVSIDYDFQGVVTVKNVPSGSVGSFLGDGKNAKLMQILTTYFFPVHVNVTWQMETLTSESGMGLSHEIFCHYLAYNSVL